MTRILPLLLILLAGCEVRFGPNWRHDNRRIKFRGTPWVITETAAAPFVITTTAPAVSESIVPDPLPEPPAVDDESRKPPPPAPAPPYANNPDAPILHDLQPPAAPRPLTLEIFERATERTVDKQTSRQVDVTVFTGEDVYGDGWCVNCSGDKRQNGDGDSNIKLTWSKAIPPVMIPDVSYPVYTWRDAKNKIRYGKGRHTLYQLWVSIQLNDPPRGMIASSQPPPVLFGNPWFESNGRTSVQHLMSEHRLTWEQLAPYANNPDALNRIHGWKHTGQGSPPPDYVARPTEPQAPSAGVAGALHGKEHVVLALEWIRTNVGEGVPITFEWHRSGAGNFPLLRNQNWSALAIFGKYGHIQLSAIGSKLPVEAIGFGYRIVGDDLVFDLDPVTVEGLALRLNPKASGAVGDGLVGFEPTTIFTIFSVIRSILAIWNTTVDVTLGGNVSATAVLQGDKLNVDFQQGPAIKIQSILNLNLGVKRVELSPAAARILFSGSRFVKERTFTID